MKELLVNNDKLEGVLFGKEFEVRCPPFGGSKCQYMPLFENDFNLNDFHPCYHSFVKRAGSELFIILKKNSFNEFTSVTNVTKKQ